MDKKTLREQYKKETGFDYLKCGTYDKYVAWLESKLLHQAEGGEGRNLISMNPQVQGGKPCVHGTRIQAEILWGMNKGGDSFELIANAYNLTIEQVKAAVDFGNKYFILNEDSPAPSSEVREDDLQDKIREILAGRCDSIYSQEGALNDLICLFDKYASQSTIKMPSEEEIEDHFYRSEHDFIQIQAALWTIKRIQELNG